MITRTQTFWKHLILVPGPTGSYSQFDKPDELSLSDEINAWLKELDVKPVFISAPAMTVVGRDQQGRLHLMASVSLLYLAEEEISAPPADSKFETGGLGRLFDAVESQLAEHVPGIKLDEVVRVIGPEDAERLGIDPATIGKRVRRPAPGPQRPEQPPHS